VGASGRAVIEVWVDYRYFTADLLRHRLMISGAGHRATVLEEYIEAQAYPDSGLDPQVGTVYRFEGDKGDIRAFDIETRARRWLPVQRDALRLDQSILSQRKDPDTYPELTYLASSFERITLFQEWSFGRRNQARSPQRADLPTDFLSPDASNLVLMLHDLVQRPKTRDMVEKYLRHLYEEAERIITKIEGGALQLYVEERGGEQISAPRLSDGTLRYLSLLAILCHPTPPPLICIEEPELGLHPDLLPTIAELLKEASTRTQLIVTTHSDALVSALSDVPESVIVCESGKGGTSLRRLDAQQLATWLDEYSLGDVWRMGEIGGTRW
jgi:predicted ATPase